QVRARALTLVRSHRLTEHLPKVRALIQDPEEEVRVQAVSTDCALGGRDPLEFLESTLAAGDAKLRTAAIFSVVEYRAPASRGRVVVSVERLRGTNERATRVAVAEALARRAGPSPLHELLGPLLRDPDLDVRRAAMKSAGHGQMRAHIAPLIDALGERH